MKWVGVLWGLGLAGCAGREPAVQECAVDRPPGLVERLQRGERAVRDLRADDARREFEYVLEVAAWLPPGVDTVDLRRRAADGMIRVRGILQERE